MTIHTHSTEGDRALGSRSLRSPRLRILETAALAFLLAVAGAQQASTVPTGQPPATKAAADTPPDGDAPKVAAAEPTSADAPAKVAEPVKTKAKDASAEPPPLPLDPGWPRDIVTQGHTFTVFQPQLDSWDRYTFKARSAVAVAEPGQEGEPTKGLVYGIVAFSARTRVDKDARIVLFDRLEINEVQFPSAPEAGARYRRILQGSLGNQVRSVSLDRIEAQLAVIEAQEKANSVPVQNPVPRLVFSNTPAMLVFIDGEPKYREVPDTNYERVLNTRPLLLRAKGGDHYLHLFDGWVTSKDLYGPYTVAKKAPKKIAKAQKTALAQQGADLLEGNSEKAPKGSENPAPPVDPPTLAKGPVPTVVVASSATELLVFEGEPHYVPIEGTQLLYADNTTGNVFKHLESQKTYVLASGRWFAAAALDGPWEFVSQSKLPKDFAAIPDDSPKENVKASVAGTQQAHEALLANTIPQTAEVNRAQAKFLPRYDGPIKLAPIDGTSLQYVLNSPDPVIRIDEKIWYAVKDGVWFFAPSPQGAWLVATSVPSVIYTIPASSPIHYVTYVKVLDSSETTVVSSYTPGYYGAVESDDVVVYGTGYYCDPWVGAYWYGCPITYGYGSSMTYTPWGGWGFTFGIGWGWGYWGYPYWGPYPSPYWGAYWGYSYYYPYYGGVAYGPYGGAVAWGPGGWAGTTGNIYHQWGNTSAVSRYSGGYNAWTGNAWRSQVGMSYNSRTGTIAAGQKGAVANVYTGQYAYGKSGIARHGPSGVTAAGGKVTVGDVGQGQVTAGRGAVYNPNTGEVTQVGGIRGESGGVARVGDDVYAGKDGQLYKRNESGGWDSVNTDRPQPVARDSDRSRDLDRQASARQSGSQRARSSDYSRPTSSSRYGKSGYGSYGGYSGRGYGGYSGGGYRAGGGRIGGGRRR